MLKLLVWLGQALFAKLPFCCLPGMVAGSLAGLVFGLLQMDFPGLTLAPGELAQAALATGAFAFLVVLLLFGLWLRYRLTEIFLPALVNSLLSAWAALWVENRVQQPALAGWIGLLMGLLVGWLLCALCRPWQGTPARASAPAAPAGGANPSRKETRP